LTLALFTEADRTAIKSALITAATEGFASVSIDGNSVQTYSLEQLQKLLAMVNDDLAGDEISHGGMRIRQLVPPGCG
jgi:hypothetical protein